MRDKVSDGNIIDFNTLMLNSLTIIPLLHSVAAPAENEYNPSALQHNSIKKSEASPLSSYLAGLIESDGSIVVPGNNIKSYKPFFEIAFHLDDLELAEILQSTIGGIVQIRGKNYCRLTIKKKKEVLKIIHLINGNMRTPKIEALHRMVKWYNSNHYSVTDKTEIIPLGLDISPLQNNNWLSGFLDGDCSFYFNWLFDKKGLPTSLQYYMRISQQQNYSHINDFFDVSYFNIMNKIALFLSVPLRSRIRERKSNFTESLYEVRSANYISNYTILSYLLKYPLFSYKYRAVPVQLELLKLSKNKNYKLTDGLKVLEDLKLKSKGDNLTSSRTNVAHPLEQAKTTDFFVHTSKYFPFF